MRFLEAFKIALTAIRSHKLRSFLTMLGIIIGIASVIMVVSMGEGSTALIEENFEAFGVNRLTLYLNGRAEGVTNNDRFTVIDVAQLKMRFEDEITAISPVVSTGGTVSVNSALATVAVTGVNADYYKIEEKTMLYGRYLNEGDIENRRDVIVIGEDLAEELFGSSAAAISQRIFIDTGKKKAPATIVGIYEYEDSIFGGMQTSFSGFMPYTTVQKITGESRYLNTIQISMAPNLDLPTIMIEMTSVLENLHDSVGDEKYRIISAEEQLSIVSNVMGTLTLLISGIAAISLLVGGIGVMNIMLVSVTERTREIGIRKAIGARRRDILIQFIIEAVFLTMIGGIIGTIIGVSMAMIIANIIDIPQIISVSSILIAWGFSALVGLFFGSYPASRAAKLDPIEALRYE